MRLSPTRGPYGGLVSGRWDTAEPGVLLLPSGRVVRGRGLGRPLPAGPLPQFAVHLLARPPAPQPWESRWVDWPDFRLPRDPADLRAALLAVWERAADERVELACRGGTGRTGTALACLSVLDGIPADRAVSYVRAHYRPRAVETPGQRAFVARFPGVSGPPLPAHSGVSPWSTEGGPPTPRGDLSPGPPGTQTTTAGRSGCSDRPPWCTSAQSRVSLR